MICATARGVERSGQFILEWKTYSAKRDKVYCLLRADGNDTARNGKSLSQAWKARLASFKVNVRECSHIRISSEHACACERSAHELLFLCVHDWARCKQVNKNVIIKRITA